VRRQQARDTAGFATRAPMTPPTPDPRHDPARPRRPPRPPKPWRKPTRPVDPRLSELDLLRIAAFALLVLYHVGMFYVPWEWHVKSPRLVPALEGVMSLSAPWRLALLFLISGAATARFTRRGTAAEHLRSRSTRLLLPLALGMLVIVPPQAWLQAVEQYGYPGNFFQFLLLYYTGYGGFCKPVGGCLVLPTWNHLWFLPYLWTYTVLWLLAQRFGWPGKRFGLRIGEGWRLLWMPLLLVATWRVLLVLRFPSTHNWVWDWFNHALYLSMFIIGAVWFGARRDRHRAWAAAARLRWPALIGALLALVGMRLLLEALGGFAALPEWAKPIWLALGALRQWLPLVAALGFARVYFHNRDGPWLRKLTEAVFPLYIVHQTVIVVAGHYLARLGWPLVAEAALLVLLAFGGGALLWVVARRVRWLRPWVGLHRRKLKRPKQPDPAEPVRVIPDRLKDTLPE
jgi:glucans biosynthesis protein C